MRFVEDLVALDADIERFMRDRMHADATTREYHYATKKFCEWAARRGVSSVLPVTLEVAVAYVATLVSPSLDPGMQRSKPYSKAVLGHARCAMKRRHADAGLSSPTDHPLFDTVHKGALRSRGPRRPKTGLPVTIEQMRAMVEPPTRSRADDWRLALLLVAVAARLPLEEAAKASRPRFSDDGTVWLELPGLDGTLMLRPDAEPSVCAATAVRAVDSSLTDDAPGLFWGRADGSTQSLEWSVLVRARRMQRLIDDLTQGVAPASLSETVLRSVALELDRRRLAWLRDRALLLTAWHLGLRFSDWRNLRLGIELRWEERGWLVHFPRAKNDQLGEGAWLSLVPLVELCPVSALDEWVEAAGLGDGDLVFGTLGRRGRGTKALGITSARVVVRRNLGRAGFDATRHATHALRYGFVVEALRQGIEPSAIADVTRHKDVAMVHGYARSDLERQSARERARLLVSAP
jgi:hypothetical protein